MEVTLSDAVSAIQLVEDWWKLWLSCFSRSVHYRTSQSFQRNLSALQPIMATVTITRPLSTVHPTPIALHLVPGGLCTASIFPSTHMFVSQCPLPTVLTGDLLTLFETGRINVDWPRREFDVVPLALGGGNCCVKPQVMRPSLPSKRMEELPIPPSTSGSEPEFITIFEKAESEETDFHREFSDLLIRSSFDIRFIERNLRYFASKYTLNVVRDREAILLLKRVLFRVFVAKVKDAGTISQAQKQLLIGLIQAKIEAIEDLPDILKTNLELMQEGIDLLSSADQMATEERKAVDTAFDVFFSAEATVDFGVFGGTFFSKSRFGQSLAIELCFEALGKSQGSADFTPVLQVLENSLSGSRPFLLYVLDDIAEQFFRQKCWHLALSSLFTGIGAHPGLSQCISQYQSPPLSDCFRSFFHRLKESSIPELRKTASTAIKKSAAPCDDYLFFAAKQTAIAACVQTKQYQSLQNQCFHSQSRTAFLSPTVVLITGIPGGNGRQYKRCVQLNIETLEFVEKPQLLHARYWHTATLVDTRVIVTGGKANKADPSLKSVESLGPSSWQTCAPMVTGRDSHSACVNDDELYVFGGATDSKYAATIEKMNAKGQWHLLEVKMKWEVMLAAVGFVEESTVLIVGGSCKQCERPSFSLNISTGECIALPPLPDKSQFVSGMYKSTDDFLSVLTAKGALYQFSLSESAWSLIAPQS